MVVAARRQAEQRRLALVAASGTHQARGGRARGVSGARAVRSAVPPPLRSPPPLSPVRYPASRRAARPPRLPPSDAQRQALATVSAGPAP
eukprot:scaffold254767_cov33-Tisochrysis_lutea.AAC.1